LLATDTLVVAKDEDPWSSEIGDKIGDSARMKTSQNPREANDKDPTQANANKI